jgi:hypothetical protein
MSEAPAYAKLPVECVSEDEEEGLGRGVMTVLRHSAAAVFNFYFPLGLDDFWRAQEEEGGGILMEAPCGHEMVAHEARQGRSQDWKPLDPDDLVPGCPFLFLADWEDWDPEEEDRPAVEAVLVLYTPGVDAATTLLSLGWISPASLEPPSTTAATTTTGLPPGVLPFKRPLK